MEETEIIENKQLTEKQIDQLTDALKESEKSFKELSKKLNEK